MGACNFRNLAFHLLKRFSHQSYNKHFFLKKIQKVIEKHKKREIDNGKYKSTLLVPII